MVEFARRMFWFGALFGCLLPKAVVGQNGTDAPTPAPSALNITRPDCFDNTTVLFEFMARASSFFEETYVLCPNSFVEIGFFDQNDECCVGGDYSLFLRSRSIVKCGESGERKNNCTIHGGNTQFFYVGGFWGDSIAQDVRVEGVTFANSGFISLAMSNRGDITFKDCAWIVSGTAFSTQECNL